MQAIALFNKLENKTVKREDLLSIKDIAFTEKQEEVVRRIDDLLNNFPEAKMFRIRLKQKIEQPAQLGAAVDGADVDIENCFELLPETENLGLGKPVSPNDLFDQIANDILRAIDGSPNLPWRKPWNLDFGFAASNFITKKPYRGINALYLNVIYPFLRKKDFKIPYFLTFNQIEQKKGTLKKGAKGFPVYYFGAFYTFDAEELEGQIKDTTKNGFIDKIKKVEDKVPLIKEIGIDGIVFNSQRLFLKYYNVFSADDIEGIDWKVQKKETPKEDIIIETAEDMIQSFKDKPTLLLEKNSDRAFYSPSKDMLTMPNKASFVTIQEFYSTFFHELVHSTGHQSRLGRLKNVKGKFGDFEYSKEELVAELGAVFLSAESGILYHTLDNSKAYLKGWKSRLRKSLEENNRFFVQATAQAQRAVEYMLKDYDAVKVVDVSDGFENPIEEKQKKEKGLAAPRHDGDKKESLTECGYLKKGFRFEKGGKVVKVGAKKPKPNNRKPAIKKPETKEDLKLLEAKGLAAPAAYEKELVGTRQLKGQFKKTGLSAAWHAVGSIERKAINDCGRLNPGFTYEKGGKIKKVASKKPKKPQNKGLSAPAPVARSKKQFKTARKAWTSVAKATGWRPNEVRPRHTSTQWIWEKKDIIKKKAVARGMGTPIVLTSEEVAPMTVFEGLAMPQDTDLQEMDETGTEEPETPFFPVGKRQKSRNPLVKKMSDLGNGNARFFRSSGDLGRFLGKVEVKPTGSVVCTLDAPQGAMKTRLFFQLINMYIENGYGGDILFLSFEEHPDSVLFTQKRDQYIPKDNQSLVDTVGEVPANKKELEDLIKDYSIIFVDSWGKLAAMDKTLELDADIRKKYDGKLFYPIYQRTGTGSMRGGSAAQFDGDMIMKIDKTDDDHTKNFAYFDKNRYQQENGLRYNIYSQSLVAEEDVQQPSFSGYAMQLI